MAAVAVANREEANMKDKIINNSIMKEKVATSKSLREEVASSISKENMRVSKPKAKAMVAEGAIEQQHQSRALTIRRRK